MITNRQAGQTSVAEVSKRDLRAELLQAEREAREKKRKAEGKPGVTLAVENGPAASADDEASKRRKLLQDALDLDKDDHDSDNEAEEAKADENDKEKKDNEEAEEDERYWFFEIWVNSAILTNFEVRMKTTMKMRRRNYCGSWKK